MKAIQEDSEFNTGQKTGMKHVVLIISEAPKMFDPENGLEFEGEEGKHMSCLKCKG